MAGTLQKVILHQPVTKGAYEKVKLLTARADVIVRRAWVNETITRSVREQALPPRAHQCISRRGE
jgi:hypothetical protein